MIIEDNILEAGENKTLFYKPLNNLWGKKARLYSDLLGHKIVEDDFTEIDDSEIVNIDGKDYIFINQSYAEIKTFVIKLHYSNDDQIALMLNYQSNPEKYLEAYNEMQSWRDFASEIASRFSPNC